MVRKQRQDEKQKIQQAIYMSKKEEARHSKVQRQNNEMKKKEYIDRVTQENTMKG